jgi:hypothetical protein
VIPILVAGATGTVGRNGRPLRTYRDFVSEITASA